MDVFSEDRRRNPYPLYDSVRAAFPLLKEPTTGLWMAFDYPTVRRVLIDSEAFSSRCGPDWLIFNDPPRHTKLRSLIAKAFTPRSVVNLELRIAEISKSLLEPHLARGQFDLATDYALKLLMRVIADMLGVASDDLPTFTRWNDVILRMSYTIGRHDSVAHAAIDAFTDVSVEMSEYLSSAIKRAITAGSDTLLARLASSELNGEKLTHAEILGFFQLLLLAGSETTTNLITNAMLCLDEHPTELVRLRANLNLLPTAIEEVLRYRSPLQWIYRIVRITTELSGQRIPEGAMILTVIGSANRDPQMFTNPATFDITRDPNPHIAFGNGQHFCMGAPLARLESRVALTDLLALKNLRRANNEPWTPREGLHVHGPQSLPVRFD